MRASYLITGDALTSGAFRVVIEFPNSQQNWVYSDFLGDLVEATNLDTFVTGGETTPEEAAAIFTTILEGIKPMPIDPGDIKWSAAPSLPATSPWLAADGSVVSQMTYAALFSAIGSTYNTGGEGAGNFRLPDLRGQVVAGVDGGRGLLTPGWANTLGGSGGEQVHTLTTGEIAAHTHTDSGHTHVEGTSTPTAITIGVGAPAPSAVPSVGVTGSGNASISTDGGGGSHNNIQPTIVLFPYIYTGG